MNHASYFVILFLTLFSCKTASVVNDNKLDNSDTTVFFKGSGTEPFWNITISDDKFVYKTPEDSIILPFTKPNLVTDGKVKLYKIETETALFSIKISQQKCTNEMSGEISPYAVNIKFKKNKSSNFETIYGCGQYVMDYRLHDIWVLEELNGKKISVSDFGNEFPMLEIYANTNKFSGFSGCNSINGSLFFEKGKLQFINIASTEKLCINANKETELITTLQNICNYSIGNNRLTLDDNLGKKIIFKKVD